MAQSGLPAQPTASRTHCQTRASGRSLGAGLGACPRTRSLGLPVPSRRHGVRELRWWADFRTAAGEVSGGPARPRPLGRPALPSPEHPAPVSGFAAAAAAAAASSAPGSGGGASGHGRGRRGRRGRRGLELPGPRSERPSLTTPSPLLPLLHLSSLQTPTSSPPSAAPHLYVLSLPPSIPPPTQARSPSFRAGSSSHRPHPPWQSLP